ncbi:hypothetical protein [Naasia lichenicola]|uniref:Glycosyl hydrolase family 98 putative carbohydrate-binding module domain-containing protein n=1 Tax=Naasia lichenicola TaxID=2565933 RepID=A0A4V3WTH8_9MICO|nr:hypothetical protein [Naasia lichenicola]THG30780.1 hypothetical protein E6C64_09075 [Naasia lichenicola]THG32017.1 hypothetical protein E6C64_08220 [Naasia lichenicola]
MRHRLPALIAGATTVALLAVLLSGCASEQPTAPGSVRVTQGNDASLSVDDGALLVDIPGDAITGTGTLHAEPLADSDGNAWSIELIGGAELTGTATVRFRHDFEEGEPPPLIASTEDGTAFEGSDVTVEDGYAVVQTTHFSTWFTSWWGDLLDKARAQMDRIYSDAGKQPTCDGEDEVRADGYEVTSDDGNRVYWCFGLDDDGSPQLRLTNGRGYGVGAENTPGMSGSTGASDLIGIISAILKPAPSQRGNTVNVLGAGDTIDYAITGTGDMGVRVQPSPSAYLLTAAQYAVDTLGLVLKAGGKGSMTKQAVAQLVNWESCLSGYSSMLTTNLQTATQAANFLNDAIGTTLGCLDDAIEKAGLGFWGVAFAEGMSWFISGVRSAANGFAGAVDTALNPSGYSIYVTAPGEDADYPTDMAQLYELPHTSAQQSGNLITATFRLPGVNGDGSTSKQTLTAEDSTEQWVGCNGTVASTDYDLRGRWVQMPWSFAVIDSAPAGLSVHLRMFLDGRVVVDKQIAEGDPFYDISTSIDVTGAQTLTVEASTDGSCGASSVGYGAFFNTYVDDEAVPFE